MNPFWRTDPEETDSYSLRVHPAAMVLTLKRNPLGDWAGGCLGMARTWNGALTASEVQPFAVRWLLETVLPSLAQSLRPLTRV